MLPPSADRSPQKPGSVRLRELRFDDYPQVAALEAQYGFTHRSYERWSHVWLNNPAYALAGKNWPIGWVLENDQGRVVGSQGNVPRWYELGGRCVIAATGRRMVVESDYRGYALWLMTALFEQQQADLCLGSVILHGIEAALAGATIVPVGAWEWYVFWMTHYPGAVAGWLNTRVPPRLRPLAGLARYPLAAALFLKDARPRSTLRRAAKLAEAHGAVVESCTSFDDRFDTFWWQLRAEHSDLLLAVRTKAVLLWHFAYALRENRLWIWTTTQAARMVAYAIFLRDASGSRVSLIDFQVLGGNAALLLPMLDQALKRCRQDHAHILENTGLAFGQSGINQIAPYRRQGAWLRFYYKAKNKDLAQTLADPAAWAPCPYERTDTIT